MACQCADGDSYWRGKTATPIVYKRCDGRQGVRSAQCAACAFAFQGLAFWEGEAALHSMRCTRSALPSTRTAWCYAGRHNRALHEPVIAPSARARGPCEKFQSKLFGVMLRPSREMRIWIGQ